MMICQLAGFLGSGTTTLMIRIGSELGKRGKKVAIIVNEVGEVGIDGAVIESFGLEMIELTEGCICCSLSGSLQNTLRILADQFEPEIILLEPTGLALPSRVNSIIHTSLIELERSVSVALVDAFRFDKIIAKTRNFFLRQIDGVDIIILNKIDLVDEQKLFDVEAALHELAHETPTVRISAKTGDGVEDFLSRLELI
jgi:G3E family GTPase